MDWTVFWVIMVIFIFLIDMDIFTSTILAIVISVVVTSLTVSDTNEITIDLEKIKFQVDNLTTKQDSVDVPINDPIFTKVISVENYDNVKRVYISNSKRSYEEVQMKTLAGKTLACKEDNNCISEPTMKRHVNNILYACDDSACYIVKVK